MGFACVWTDRAFLRGCCVLRDAIYVFSRFQQRMQDNDLLLSDIATDVGHVCERLDESLESENDVVGDREEGSGRAS